MSYIPNELPLSDLKLDKIVAVMGRANAALAKYDGLLESLPNPQIMLSPLMRREAVLSSQIEGTQATEIEVLEEEAGEKFSGSKKDDLQEISNYRSTMSYAAASLEDRTISLSLIKSLHQTLMDSVRGKNKQPGRFRDDQNWIGQKGCVIEEASFVPPSPLILQEYLEKWEAYLTIDDFDALVQCAIVHAQFELIHPFTDGNGRIGRLLIPLFLYQKKALVRPAFYLSEYLENNRDEYYMRLQNISQRGEWSEWIAFFLRAIIEQAAKNTSIVRDIRSLHEMTKEWVRDITHSQYSAQVADFLLEKPMFTSSDLIKFIPKPTAHTIIRQLVEEDVLVTAREAAGRRPAIFAFGALLKTAGLLQT